MNNTYNFDEPVNREGSDSYKWDLEGENGKMIPLGVADSDFRAPEQIINAVKQKVDFGVYGYGALPQKRFAQAVTGWYKKRYEMEIPEESICSAQGIMAGALWMLLLALTEVGDTVLIQEPVYHNMRIVTENMGRQVISNKLKLENGRYIIDWEDLEAKIKKNETRILLLCSPHNPVGKVFTKAELERIGRLCIENNVFVISDEIHSDIVYEPYKHVPIIGISEELAENSAIMNSPSKTFNLAGFYSAYVIITNEEIRRKYQSIYEQFHFDYNFMGIEALIAAYNECEDYVDAQNEYFRKNIEIVKEFMKTYMPEVIVIEPQASYLLWLDFRAWNLQNSELMQLLRRWGVKLNDGGMYGEPGNGFLRLNVATQAEILKQAMERIRCGYEQWKR